MIRIFLAILFPLGLATAVLGQGISGPAVRSSDLLGDMRLNDLEILRDNSSSDIFRQYRDFPSNSQDRNYFRLRDDNIGDSSLKITFPPDTTDDNKQKVSSLLEQINTLCPACSTGGTIGGNTIVGANVRDVQRPLFTLLDNNTVTIPKTEYDELVNKASKYDALFP